MVMHVPYERAMPSSSSRHVQSSSRLPASPPRTSRRRCRCPVSGPASALGASDRQARKSPAGSSRSRPSASRARSCRSRRAAPRRPRGWTATVPRSPSPQVAIEHRRGLHERLAQRHRGYFHREPAGLPDAALDVVGALDGSGHGTGSGRSRCSGLRPRACRRSLRWQTPSAWCASDGRKRAGRRRRTSDASGVFWAFTQRSSSIE